MQKCAIQNSWRIEIPKCLLLEKWRNKWCCLHKGMIGSSENERSTTTHNDNNKKLNRRTQIIRVHVVWFYLNKLLKYMALVVRGTCIWKEVSRILRVLSFLNEVLVCRSMICTFMICILQYLYNTGNLKILMPASHSQRFWWNVVWTSTVFNVP